MSHLDAAARIGASNEPQDATPRIRGADLLFFERTPIGPALPIAPLGGDPGTATLPTVTVRAGDATAAEVPAGGTANVGRFRLSRTGDLSESLTVSYTLGGSATNGVDYARRRGTATFAAGKSAVTVTIAPIDDAVFEGDETVQLSLQDEALYDLGTAARATLTLRDNDPAPEVSVRAVDATAAEVPAGGTVNNGRFRLSRTGDLSEPLTVMFTLAGTATNGVDYRNRSGTATFAAGKSTVAVTIAPIDDAVSEGDETVVLTLRDGTRYDPGAAARATVTLRDDDPAGPPTPTLISQFGVPTMESPADVLVTSTGEVWLGGRVATSLARAPGQVEYGFNDLTTDAWVARFDAKGQRIGDFGLLATPRIGPIIQGENIWYGYYDEQVFALTRDADGNIYTVGEIMLTGLIARGNDPSTPDDNSGTIGRNSDIFVAKYGPDGEFKYATVVVDATLFDTATGIAIDDAGDLYISGHVGTADSPQAGGLVVKLDSSRLDADPDSDAIVWSGLVGNKVTYGKDIAIGNDGFLYSVGETGAKSGIGPSDVYVSKYSIDGTLEYAKYLRTTPATDEVYGMATDGRGGYYAVGISDTYGGNATLVDRDSWLIKFGERFDTRNKPDWERITAETARLRYTFRDVDVDSSGNVYVAGLRSDKVTGSEQAIVIKYTADGTRQWETPIGAAGIATGATAIDVGPDDSIVVAGIVSGNLAAPFQGEVDVFYAKLASSSGAVLMTQIGRSAQPNTSGIHRVVLASGFEAEVRPHEAREHRLTRGRGGLRDRGAMQAPRTGTESGDLNDPGLFARREQTAAIDSNENAEPIGWFRDLGWSAWDRAMAGSPTLAMPLSSRGTEPLNAGILAGAI